MATNDVNVPAGSGGAESSGFIGIPLVAPCPTCNRCPTCGHYKYPYFPQYPSFPQIYC